ncbi:MAG: hypothetical protein ACTSYC_04820, partial [Promethearchaeota archaeon]
VRTLYTLCQASPKIFFYPPFFFSPLCDELARAIATKGDRFKIFPGQEAFLNLKHIISQIEHFLSFSLPKQLKRSLTTAFTSLLALFYPLFEELE